MDNGEGPSARHTDTHKEVWDGREADREPLPYQPGDGDSCKEVYSILGDERNFASDLPPEDVVRLLQVAEGEETLAVGPNDELEVPAMNVAHHLNGGDTNKEVYSIFGDERNFASDLPLEEVIHLLQVAEGEELLPAGPLNALEVLGIAASGLQATTAGGPTSPNHLVAGDTPPPEMVGQINTASTYIPGLSIVGDDRNYIDGEISLQEISHLLEAAEGRNPTSPGSIEGGGSFLTTRDIGPDPDPFNVHNVSIVRDFRNYVGDVTLPDVAGILGAADEAEIARMRESSEFQETSSDAPDRVGLCHSCSRINLAFGCSHLNLAALRRSAESGCPCCQLLDKALEDIGQHPRRAPSPKPKPESGEISGTMNGSDAMLEEDNSDDESALGTLQVSKNWARESNIEIELARNMLIYKVFDAYHKDGRRYNGRDILKFFEFCESRDDYLPRYRSIFGRLLELDPGSEEAFALIFQWLEVCTDGHTKCEQDQHQTQLPRRVIDVWEETPVLVESCGKCAPYILLSHCWGDEQTLTTTQETLSKRSQGIPMDMFPKTFQDAVTITRILGIQYLWIDSLCIVQDLEEDWICESGNMKDYYRNGYLTISALYSPHSHHGILNLRQDIPPVQLSPNANLYIRPRLPDHREIFRNAPLNNRAWALQERLLSTRILHYSDKEMFWECQTCSARESSALVSDKKTDPDTVITSEGEDFKRVLSHLDDDPYSVVDGAFVTWYRLVTNYSRRVITFESDKLPAISGLASLIESKIGATYLAGIWKEDIRSLLWLRDISRPDSKTRKDTDPAVPHCQSPSWSWASATGPIRYRYEEAILSGHEAVILSYNLPNSSTEYPIEGLDGYLVLRAKCRPLIYQRVFDRHHEFVRVSLYEDFSESSSMLFAGEGYMDFSMDDNHCRRHDTQTTPLHTCKALWIVEQRGDPYQTIEGVEYIKNLMCLLVQKIDEPMGSANVESRTRWKRIGVGIMKDAFPGDEKWSGMENIEIV